MSRASGGKANDLPGATDTPGPASVSSGQRVTLWGTRGSIASAGPETVAYGGNTSCVELEAGDGTIVILDAGTGIRRVGDTYHQPRRLDILLTHLHMDHIQGLGFFGPFFQDDFEVHIWGPPSTTQDLRTRLTRYLSPPLFPVRLRDVAARLELHDVPAGAFRLGELTVCAQSVIHPGPTLGYRLTHGSTSVAYIPDHEPALGMNGFPEDTDWLSGHELARGVDLLIHDVQYSADEYNRRAGWGHSRISDAVGVAALAGARRLVTFHHDPAHDDAALDAMLAEARQLAPASLEVLPGREGDSFRL